MAINEDANSSAIFGTSIYDLTLSFRPVTLAVALLPLFRVRSQPPPNSATSGGGPALGRASAPSNN